MKSSPKKNHIESLESSVKKELEIKKNPRAGKPELIVDNDLGFEKKFGEMPPEIRKLRTDKVKIFQNNVKMLDAFKSDYRREIRNIGERPRIFVLNSGKHVETNVVFKNADITNITETTGKALTMERLGAPAEKFDPEMQLTEPVDIMIAFYDEDAEANWRFVRNIAHGGLLLCRGGMAAKLLKESTNFKCLGTLAEGGGMEHSDRSRREDYWEQAVKNDAEFKAASEKIGGGRMVTYDEAVDALREAGRATGEQSSHVLENYKKLLEDARAHKDSVIDEEKGTITYKGEGMENSIELKIEPPFGDVDSDKVFVLQKMRQAESR